MAPPSPHRSPAQANGACSEDGIRVVDMAVLVNGDADQRAQAIRHLGRACQEWGIFMVINHGVPEALQAATMDACKELLLSLPTEDKAEYMDGSPMDPVRVGTGFVNSAVDGARYWRDYVKMFVHPDFHCPSKPANLREVAKEYAACTRGLMLELVAAISESLGLDGGRIAQALNLESCLQTLVANHYPPYSGPDDDDGSTPIGLPAHSDYGLLTLLFQNGVDGLQVQHDGQWLLAKPLPGSFFVIAGDQLEIVSNGRYKAALHRAWIGGERRMSVLALIAPCLDTVVEPVPELAREGPEGVEFRGIRFRDYMESHQSSRLVGKTALDIVRVQR
ncbi:hypothetical protein BRADI_3g38480v3 [Brachypodium distachyon]|uniref:Fe2OG dioxygenase domain-containing protein n=2 Tax=Brachypodium distachyon TaxID=15368 RepID=I1I7Y3_BRADI|nr:hypothetical protein BRADI_3g38480v3 [Brachypodium distachyon]